MRWLLAMLCIASCASPLPADEPPEIFAPRLKAELVAELPAIVTPTRSDVGLHTDCFYGDLDRDGLAEVTVTRVLGSPKSMVRQLGGSSPLGEPRALLLTGSDLRKAMENNRETS